MLFITRSLTAATLRPTASVLDAGWDLARAFWALERLERPVAGLARLVIGGT
jgi:hypothetical protein